MRQTVTISLEIEVEFLRNDYEESSDLTLQSVSIEGSKVALGEIAGVVIKAAESEIDERDWE